MKGRVKEVNGKIKKIIGSVVGNKTLEQAGSAREMVDKTPASFGDLKDDLQKRS